MATDRRIFEYKENAFDLLRIFAAMQVMLGHIAVHLNWPDIGSGLLDNVIQILEIIPGRGVIIFFAISGYLAMASVGDNSFFDYCIKKFARIYPGLWFAFVVNTIIIAILHGLPSNLLDNVIYFVTQTTVFQFYTRNWLRDYGVGTANGALWTISVLIQFYVVVYVLYKRCIKWHAGGWIAVIAGMQLFSIILSNCSGIFPEIPYKLITVSFLPYFYIFLIGMFLYRYQEQLIWRIEAYLPVLLTVYISVKIILINMEIPCSIGVNYDIVSATLLSVIVIGLAYKLGCIKLKYEISYGLYIWHMIIVNVGVEIVKRNGWETNGMLRMRLSILIIVLSIMVAWLSTVFIERPAKKKIMNINKRMKNLKKGYEE